MPAELAPTLALPDQTIAVKHFIQSTGLCGPASIKILLSYFGKEFSEAQLAQLASATTEVGTEHEGMIQALKEVDGFVFAKAGGTLEELEYFVREEKLPVIVGWFDRTGDHYSVVVNVTDKNVIMVDPATDEPERWVDRATFPSVWFDFIDDNNQTVSWRWYMVATFDKRRFKVKGGNYF